jgi:hypothetical protein
MAFFSGVHFLTDSHCKLRPNNEGQAEVQVHKGQLEAATEIIDQMSARVSTLEATLYATNATSFLQAEQIAALLAWQNATVTEGAVVDGGCGADCSAEITAVEGKNVRVSGDEVVLESSQCSTSSSELCALKHTVQALADKFGNL